MPTDNQTPQTPRDRFIERLTKGKGADGAGLKLSAEELSSYWDRGQALAVSSVAELLALYPKTAKLMQFGWLDNYFGLDWDERYLSLWRAAYTELSNFPMFRLYLYPENWYYNWGPYGRAALKEFALLPKTKAFVAWNVSTF